MASSCPIVGPEVPDQSRLRVPAQVTDIDEFVRFLARLEAVFGVIESPRQRTTGRRFLL